MSQKQLGEKTISHDKHGTMRKLTPELLDHLPHDDPSALRSRRDLLRINLFMGNESKLKNQIHRSVPELAAHPCQLSNR